MSDKITDADIFNLAHEAYAAGDTDMVDVCSAALAGKPTMRRLAELAILDARAKADEEITDTFQR